MGGTCSPDARHVALRAFMQAARQADGGPPAAGSTVSNTRPVARLRALLTAQLPHEPCEGEHRADGHRRDDLLRVGLLDAEPRDERELRDLIEAQEALPPRLSERIEARRK